MAVTRWCPEMRQDTDYDEHADFVEAWERTARASLEAGSLLMRCPFLEGENVCGLQHRKPPICSDSLSWQSLQARRHGVYPSVFFHRHCGFLNGAPEEFLAAVRAHDELQDGTAERFDGRFRRYRRRAQELVGGKAYHVTTDGWRVDDNPPFPFVYSANEDDESTEPEG